MRKVFLLLAACIAFEIGVFAQQTVTGTVSDEEGVAMPGVSIMEKGTTKGTVTNLNGNYTIEASSQNATLVFSFLGYLSEEVQVGGQTTIDVSLVPDILALDEVVVTALGISKEKKALGYAVTEVESDDISLVKDHNPANSLAGKVAGVVVTQGTGGPGSGARIVIRGNNSINGDNQPLIVVDGIPIDNTGSNSGGSVYNSTVTGGGITDINPDDIESISVLKGPNAAALYGSRAGNGVLLITTKKGTKGKGIGVSFNSNITFDTPMVLPDFQNEYGQGTQGYVPSDLTDLKNASSSWGAKMDGSEQLYYTGETRPYVAQENNVKDFFRTGGRYINTLSLDGGGENYSIRFSYTNNSTESILPSSGLNSHNFNLRTLVDLSDKLKVDAKATYFTQSIDSRVTSGTEGIMETILTMPRNVDVKDLETYQNLDEGYSSISYNALGSNPYWILKHDENGEDRSRFMGFVKATYEFTDWLSAFARIGTDATAISRERVDQYGNHYYSTGRLALTDIDANETTADFVLMLNKNLTDDFNLSVTAGTTHSYRTYESTTINGEDFKIPTRATVANCITQTISDSPLSEHVINSVYGQVSLSYKNFAYLDLTGRNDWSSTLAEDNRSYFYPSVTGSILINELLDPDASIFNLLKVRGSWANVGNDTDPYQLYEYYILASDGYLGVTQLSRPSVKYTEDLKPENIASMEFGLEGSLLNNRLFFDFSLYNIKTTDQIYEVEVPASTGYSYYLENIGEVTNKGIELMFGGTPVKAGDFTWEISANFSKNKNELVSLTEDLDSHIFNTTNSGNVVIQATVGGGYGDIYGTTWRTNDAGQIVVDASGRPQESTDKVYLGNSQPDWIGGLTNTLSYKDVALKFLIDARIGGKIYSQTSASLVAQGITTETLEYREDGITVDGVVEESEGVYTQNTTLISAQDYWGSVSDIASEFVFDQTNIRMRELVLSYNLPRTILKDGFIKSASLSFVGRNLFFLYKEMDHFDPEANLGTGNTGQGIMSYNLPTVRSLGFNVNIKF